MELILEDFIQRLYLISSHLKRKIKQRFLLKTFAEFIVLQSINIYMRNDSFNCIDQRHE